MFEAPSRMARKKYLWPRMDEAAVLLAALGHVSAAVDGAQERDGGHHHG